MYSKTICIMTLLLYKNICVTLLIDSGDVESNPGPSKDVKNLCLIER